MEIPALEKLVGMLSQSIEAIPEGEGKFSNLIDKIGDARFVLIGEASHGTYEFYQSRIEISQRLIKEKDFMAVAIEGDWPDAYEIHRYIQGKGDDPLKALAGFKHFPKWLWRNETLPPFLKWLRSFNDHLKQKNKIGFYGLDLYSLYTSIQAVINYLAKVDPDAAEQARKYYACFDHFEIDLQTYGYLVNSGIKKSCYEATILQLLELQHHAFEYIKKDGLTAKDEYFNAAQNARLVKNAEAYYRSMFKDHITSWNLRDEHMAETLNELINHLEERHQKPAKIIIWAHNSHIGDARATEMGSKGELNIGQLVRERYDTDCYSVGFSTYEGTVTAASDWGAKAEIKQVNPGLEGSCEALFHEIKQRQFLLDLRQNEKLNHYLQIPRLQRAIGVIYRPETERESHYFFTRLPYQFDSIIHFDVTKAVTPLDLQNSYDNEEQSTLMHE